MKTSLIISLTTAALLVGSPLAVAQDDGTPDCTILGAESVTTATAEAVAAATAAQVIRLDCPGNTPAADILDAALANDAIATVLGQESVGGGEILAVGVEAGTAVIYASGSEDDE